MRLRPAWHHLPIDTFRNRRTFIIGGGPSLRGFDASILRGKGAVIAVNNAMLDLAPWADVGFFADRRWYDWNKNRLHAFQGLLLTRGRVPKPYAATLRHDPNQPLSHAQDTVCGQCGGSSAINIAYLMGAAEIVLLGFDMRDGVGNYHADHKKAPLSTAYARRFVPAIERMAEPLRRAGVRVYNCTVDSALTAFPVRNLENFL